MFEVKVVQEEKKKIKNGSFFGRCSVLQCGASSGRHSITQDSDDDDDDDDNDANRKKGLCKDTKIIKENRHGCKLRSRSVVEKFNSTNYNTLSPAKTCEGASRMNLNTGMDKSVFLSVDNRNREKDDLKSKSGLNNVSDATTGNWLSSRTNYDSSINIKSFSSPKQDLNFVRKNEKRIDKEVIGKNNQCLNFPSSKYQNFIGYFDHKFIEKKNLLNDKFADFSICPQNTKISLRNGDFKKESDGSFHEADTRFFSNRFLPFEKSEIPKSSTLNSPKNMVHRYSNGGSIPANVFSNSSLFDEFFSSHTSSTAQTSKNESKQNQKSLFGSNESGVKSTIDSLMNGNLEKHHTNTVENFNGSISSSLSENSFLKASPNALLKSPKKSLDTSDFGSLNRCDTNSLLSNLSIPTSSNTEVLSDKTQIKKKEISVVLLHAMSQLLKTGIDKNCLRVIFDLCEQKHSPVAIAAVFLYLQANTQRVNRRNDENFIQRGKDTHFLYK